MALAEANRKFFDLADLYDNEPWKVKADSQITDAVRGRLDWISVTWAKPEPGAGVEGTEEVRLLDYACGTGLISRVLGPYVTTITGIDISPNMVSAYSKHAADAGIPSSKLSAVVGDLFTPEPSSALAGPEYFNFDIAAVGSAYHHFEDVELSTKRLVERLKPGGVLFIIDLIQEPGTDHFHGHEQHGHGHRDPNHGHDHNHERHPHHGHDHGGIPQGFLKALPKQMVDSIQVSGFNETSVRAFFEKAGLVDFGVTMLDEKLRIEHGGRSIEKTVFLARGTKPIV
ncbi:S-adenosyl-L-methionine-dependent methyltransferase [Glonium stellatum]|uniref:S-adenosyl-L-methionine-dependent methyltransferase n=1 Tax=Glonium stellatum TaxID=574774 RepID=A0A8E2FDZ6_9PEZI|nr:S-adenosyl-L-methionine-dependent methyltransferase [Glonium stellatum]